MLGGTSESHLVQPPCSSRATQPQLPRTVSRQLLNTPNDRDPRTPLGNLLQYFVNLRVKKCFVMFRGNLLCFSLFLLPLVLSSGTTEKRLASLSFHRITEWFGLDRTSKNYLIQPPCNEQGHLQLNQVA